MVMAWADRIAVYLIRKEWAYGEDQEVLAYFTFCLLSGILHISLLLAAAVFIPHVLVFALFFCSLKSYIGGAHLKKHWQCLWGFTALALLLSALGVLLADMLPLNAVKGIAVGLSMVAGVLVYLCAPIAHPNRPVSRRRLMRSKKTARIIASVQLMIILLTCLMAGPNTAGWLLAAALGQSAATMTLLPNHKVKEVVT